MPIDLDSVQTFTDAEIVKVLRRAMVDAAIAEHYAVGGKSLARFSPVEIQKLIEVYESRVAAASAGTDRMRPLLSKFGRTR